MVVYHVTKTEEAYQAILASGVLLPGRNVKTKTVVGVHLSLTPFIPGCYALDVICGQQGWLLTLEIADDTELLPDPSGEDQLYGGKWVIHPAPLAVVVLSASHVPNILAWEERQPASEVKIF